jgi:uncharacterized membrane protein
MPNLASWHPIFVHFSIALVVVGVLLRWVSLLNRIPFSGPSATTFLLAGALASFLAARSGLDAHGPVERVPGSAVAVKEHEDWGNRASRLAQIVALVEIVALAVRRRPQVRWVVMASAVLGAPLLFAIYEAGEHGGELVYSYAGGVGIRSGDPADVGRLLVAATYHQAEVDRKAGRREDAARLYDELGRRYPNDAGIQVSVAESQLLDRKDAPGALAALGRITVPTEDLRLRVRHGLLNVDALEAAGRPDAARAALQQLASAFPDNRRVKQRLAGGARPAP